jgi:uncharacterized membrane protein HdeD (DUF308 family)
MGYCAVPTSHPIAIQYNSLPEATMSCTPLFYDLDKLHRRWGWFVFLGIILIMLGIVALIITPAATLGTVLVLGWLLVLSGMVEAFQAFRMRKWGGIFLHLLAGILGVFIGLLVVTHPIAGALTWTLLFASFCTVMGLFRLIAAIRLKFPNWGWGVFDGIVSLALGILLWAQWPWSGYWFLGVAAGISLILRGWSYIMLALAAHSFVLPVEVRRAA